MSYGQQFKVREVPSIVQELVAGGVQEPPGQYVVPEKDRPAAAVSEMPEPIPVVDLSRLSANSADELAKLRSALENWDLFLAVGHGMEPRFLAEAMKVMREFFKLQLEEKQKYSNIVDGKTMSSDGYGNDMVVVENQVLDWNDRLSLFVEPESERAYICTVANTTTFFQYTVLCRDILCEYAVRCRVVANLILQNLAKLLNLQEEYLTTMLGEKSLTQATINYYPRCPKPDHVLGLKPHTDASMITINFVDADVSGLQLQKNDIWYNVPIVANALVVNIGDVMEVVSNGYFKSLMHRVVTNVEKERLSLVTFYALDPEAEIEPVPELVNDKRPRHYRKMKTKDYLAKFYDTYATGKLAIETMKI